MVEIANLVWIMGMGALGCLVWFIRLEAKVIYLEKDHDKLVSLTSKSDAAFETKIDKLSIDLNEIRVILARIEGSFSHNKYNQPGG